MAAPVAVVAEAKALTEPAGLEIPHPQALRKDQMAVFLLLLLVELAAVAEVQAQQEVRLALVELAAVAQERRLVFLVVPSHTLVVGVVAVILEISLLLVAQAALGEVEAQLEKILQADRRLAGQGVPLAPVLIEGETGTGKTSLARWLHRRGPRAKGPLIEVNCSALPESLAESELFGHERGAFTDAKEARLGLIEAAEGGTLFLDELPSLSAAIQAKLLKAIEDRAVRRVGGNRMVAVDARIIAATHRSLPAEVARGAFRADLMHRLDLLRVRIPPLRERGRDVVVLAERLVASLARRYGLPPMTIPAEGAVRLMAQPWPGNVRELAHEIERAMVFDDAQLTFRGLARAAVEGGAGWEP